MRTAVYARVSTEEQKEGKTIDSQIRELDRLAERLEHSVVERYVDEGWSGSLLSRPALDRLRDDATTGQFQAVLCTDVDRLSRDLANLAVVKRDLEAKGVRLMFQNVPSDNSPLSDFMVNILGSFAEFERAIIRDRTRRGRRFKAQERQQIVGHLPPYGYNYVKKNREGGVEGHYEINPHETDVVRMIYTWVGDEGLSERAVVRRLRSLGLWARQGRPWGRSSVHRILVNETYAGTTYYNKHELLCRPAFASDGRATTRKSIRRVRDRADWIPIRLPDHLRIISPELQGRVQSQLAHNRATSPRNTRYFYLLRSVRRTCGRCGGSYLATPSRGRRYYRCSSRDSVDRKPCQGKLVKADVLDHAVWQVVDRVVRDPHLLVEQVKLWQARLQRDAIAEVEDVAKLERELAVIADEEDRVLAAYRHGATTLTQFEREIGKVNARRSAVDKRLTKARRQRRRAGDHLAVPRTIESWTRRVRDRLANLTDAEKQEVVGNLLNEVVVDDTLIRLRGEVPLHDGADGHRLPSSAGDATQPDTGRIAPTPEEGSERNATWPFEITVDLATQTAAMEPARAD